MAKAKKGKKDKARKNNAPAPQQANKPISLEKSQAPDSAPKTQASKNETAPTPELPGGGGKVRVSTCIAGMFLCLVLGIYLGTLLPGIVNDAQAPPQPVAQTEKAQAPEAQGNMALEANIDPRMRKVITDLEKKAAANIDSAPDWINLGNAYFDAHMPKEAIRAYERALALAPRNADVLTDLGIMYRETGAFDKAVECFRKAVEIEPGHQNAMFNEGVVLSTDLGKKLEAAEAWERLLKINPQAHAPNGAPLGEMIKNLRQ